MNQLPFGEVRAWMFEGALPFWAAKGIDPSHGGFLEELGFDGEPTDCPFKRVRVICRQIYVFSHAAVLGWAPGAELSRLGFDYLLEKARLPDGGWARVLSRAGDVIDPTPDLYDLSFVLFAMAWRFRASGDQAALGCAHETLDYMHARMRTPDGEGFYPKWPPSGIRLQNPHMHFAEASVAAFEASADERFLDQAGELIGVFRRRLFDGRILGEIFTDDWRRVPGEEGRTLEPGHHFEWAWILAQYQRLKGADLSGEASALASFAERFGVDARSGAVFDAVRDDGAQLRTTSRAWTNTERIKAWLALFELTGRDPRREVAGSLHLLFGRYFAGLPLGLWRDQFDAEGQPLSKAVPASIVYHLFLAFSEVLRLQPRLIALDRSPA